MKYTDNFRFERRLYLTVLQLLPVDVAVEEMIFDFTFLTGCHTAAKSGIRCLHQQLYTSNLIIITFIIIVIIM